MRVLLAYKSHLEGAEDPYTSLLPIGIGYLHAVVASRGFHSTVENFSRCDDKMVSSRLAAYRPDIVGISVFTHNRFESMRLAALVKSVTPGCVVVLGGPHASHRYVELLRNCTTADVVVRGEGEETFAALVEAFARGERHSLADIPGIAFRDGDTIRVTDDRLPIKDLDSLPSPAEWMRVGGGVDSCRQLEFVTTSRGCPASCRFCSSPSFWQRKVRFRSPRAIVDEIRFIRDNFGLLYFSFRDDTFTADKRRVMELCRLLIEEKVYIMWNCQSRVGSLDDEMLLWMKRAGCECVQIGVESGSLPLLGFLAKGIDPARVEAAARSIRCVGINLSVYLISGIPGEGQADVAATMKLVETIRPHDGQVSPLAYYPGTALFTDSVASGAVEPNLFEVDHSAALLVRKDAEARKSGKLLLDGLQKVSGKSIFRAKDFKQHKAIVGYCHGTNILAGTWFEEQGEWDRAEAEYLEILAHEPENPWGWLAIGEMKGELGLWEEADTAFSKVCALVPNHAPAYAARGEVARLSGNRQAALTYYRKALELDATDPTGREGLRMLGARN